MPRCDNDLLTSSQAGAILGKSARTVLRLAESGHIPIALKLPGPNGHYLFSRKDIAAYLADEGVPT